MVSGISIEASEILYKILGILKDVSLTDAKEISQELSNKIDKEITRTLKETKATVYLSK